MKGELFLKSSAQYRANKSLGECLAVHEQVAGRVYDLAVESGDIQRDISYKTYFDIGVKLITAAFESVPSAAAIRIISVGTFVLFTKLSRKCQTLVLGIDIRGY